MVVAGLLIAIAVSVDRNMPAVLMLVRAANFPIFFELELAGVGALQGNCTLSEPIGTML
jgi:hypothetical protein